MFPPARPASVKRQLGKSTIRVGLDVLAVVSVAVRPSDIHRSGIDQESTPRRMKRPGRSLRATLGRQYQTHSLSGMPEQPIQAAR